MRAFRLLASAVLVLMTAGLVAIEKQSSFSTLSTPSPPFITSLRATSSSLTLTWRLDTSSSLVKLQVAYVAPLRTQAVADAASVPLHSRSFTFTHLESHRLYKVSVIASTATKDYHSSTWVITTP